MYEVFCIQDHSFDKDYVKSIINMYYHILPHVLSFLLLEMWVLKHFLWLLKIENIHFYSVLKYLILVLEVWVSKHFITTFSVSVECVTFFASRLTRARPCLCALRSGQSVGLPWPPHQRVHKLRPCGGGGRAPPNAQRDSSQHRNEPGDKPEEIWHAM